MRDPHLGHRHRSGHRHAVHEWCNARSTGPLTLPTEPFRATRRLTGGAEHGPEQLLGERIDRFGPRPFDEVIDVALYDPDAGFYSTGGRAGGSRGQFLTSPEVGPLFGAVLARALDAWWHELGEPDPFTVVEGGAGVGTLANAIRIASPDCLRALTYVLVERSAAQRARQGEHLPLVVPALAFPPEPGGDEHAEGEARSTGSAGGGGSIGPDFGRGPRFVSLAELPQVPITGVVLANELLDNLAFRLLEHRSGTWNEVLVGRPAAATGVRLGVDLESPRTAKPDGPVGVATVAPDGLVEVLTAAPDDLAGLAARLVPAPRDGARIPVQRAAGEWLRRALALVERGRVVVFDYASTTAELAERDRQEWLRTYRDHGRGTSPLVDLGAQDVTVEVCVDQLARVRVPTADLRQADFLLSFGIDEMVAEGRLMWAERAHVADLEAIGARSRIREAEALCDPEGLGAFSVLEWVI